MPRRLEGAAVAEPFAPFWVEEVWRIVVVVAAVVLAAFAFLLVLVAAVQVEIPVTWHKTRVANAAVSVLHFHLAAANVESVHCRVWMAVVGLWRACCRQLSCRSRLVAVHCSYQLE